MNLGLLRYLIYGSVVVLVGFPTAWAVLKGNQKETQAILGVQT